MNPNCPLFFSRVFICSSTPQNNIPNLQICDRSANIICITNNDNKKTVAILAKFVNKKY